MTGDATGLGLPSELLVPPQPLVGFCGLDVNHNVLHKSIWDAFSTNRKADRAAVHFKLLPANYEYPVAKPKRASYEWYHPKGILKRNWMLKHLHVLPAVVVVFQEMEWNDAQWTEKQLHCVSTLQALRNSLQERNTRLCLVLLQRQAPLPPGEDLLASERAATLATACNINCKMLYILPHTEHLMGYTLRLESAFLDMAQSYYAAMAKRIRAHRDQLTAAHTTLKIRHQFKLGFVAEMRQDFSNGLKHYTQAYANLDEVRMNDQNILEIKTVAGFLNYKVCRLMFKLKVPRDAINHFVSHIEKYKNRFGNKDLAFEHYAWLSAQHSVFAELFCDAIKNGLPALQTQHPGIYFHKAAEYVTKRKEAFLQAQAQIASAPSSSASHPVSFYTEYFGIRAVKSGDPLSEQQMNQLILENERSFNHSGVIIDLLSQAMAQFKAYKCLRFRKKLMIDTADEYFKSCDYSRALTLYSLMLPDYRSDKWSVIFSDVLQRTLRCALLSASVADYISCTLESLSLKVNNTNASRKAALENLWKVFECVPLSSPTGQLPGDDLHARWEKALTTQKSPIHIDLDKITAIFEMCATFDKVQLRNDDTIKLHLIIRLLTDVPLKISSFGILLTDGPNVYKLQSNKFATFKQITELRKQENAMATASPASVRYQHFEKYLRMEPNIYYRFLYTIEAQQFMENTQLSVARIELQMGTNKLWTVLTKAGSFVRGAFRHYNRARDLDDNISLHPLCYIAPTFHLVTQTNLDSEPMLVNEYFPVNTVISNPYNVFLQNVVLDISVPQQLQNKVFLATDVSSSRQKLHSNIQIDIGDLPMQATNTISYYVFSLIETTITLQQKINYTLDVMRPKAPAANITVLENVTPNRSSDNSPDNVPAALGSSAADVAVPAAMPPVHVGFIDENSMRKTREDTLELKCGLEFQFQGRFYTMSKRPLQTLYRGENFLFRANIEIQADTELEILETYMICDHNITQSSYSFKRKKFTNIYRKGEKLEDVIVLRTNATLDEWLTAKEFEQRKDPQYQQQEKHLKMLQHVTRAMKKSNYQQQQPQQQKSRHHCDGEGGDLRPPSVTDSLRSGQLGKSLEGKIPNTLTIVNAKSVAKIKPSAQLAADILVRKYSNTSIITEADRHMLAQAISAEIEQTEREFNINQPKGAAGAGSSAAAFKKPNQQNTRFIYNKAMDVIQATGHCRGFIKGIVHVDDKDAKTSYHQQQQQYTPFGIYCVKWRRHGSKDENESKFIINGMDIEVPPLNIYCTIEEKMFVKMPMTFKIVLRNPTTKVLHLIATLSINNTNNFICSGHKQIDISIFALDEKALVYNLYPMDVGWQKLPELTLEYNTQADPSRDASQNELLSELVQRSIPKKVFVLPPLKQQSK